MEALVLRVQRLVDRWSRWLRLSPAAASPAARRFLIIQIDGLSRAALDQALASPPAAEVAERDARIAELTGTAAPPLGTDDFERPSAAAPAAPPAPHPVEGR